MSDELLRTIFLTVGIILVVSELFLPGLISGFLGASALLTALLLHLDIISGFWQSFFVFMLLSLMSLLIVRRLLVKMFPSMARNNYIEEEVEEIGQIAEVVTAIDKEENSGRIRFRGTSWPARTNSEQRIEIGSQVRIVFRDNIGYWVEKSDA